MKAGAPSTRSQVWDQSRSRHVCKGTPLFGFDISPAAIAISRAKLEPVNHGAVENVIEALRLYIGKRRTRSVDLDSLNGIRFNGPLPAYFHPETLKEIVAAREFFHQRTRP